MTPKIVRTPKKWTEPCRECGGSGHVQKREYFALWTPDEYEGTETLDPKHDVPQNAYVCTAVPGSTINEACREAIGLVKLVNRPVAFEFNGAVAVCHQDSDPDRIVRAWWLKAYGETYEQSMAKR
jgi:hypothetical protein